MYQSYKTVLIPIVLIENNGYLKIKSKLTVIESARLLNVSSEYVLKILPLHEGNSSIYVKIEDLLECRSRRNAERRSALLELTQLWEELN